MAVIYNCFFIQTMIILNKFVSGLAFLMTLGLHSYVSLEFLYSFIKVPTNILLLFIVQTYVPYLYLSGSTMSLC